MLKRDETTTDGGCRDLRLVEGNRSRGETDGETRNNTTRAKHTTVLGIELV